MAYDISHMSHLEHPMSMTQPHATYNVRVHVLESRMHIINVVMGQRNLLCFSKSGDIVALRVKEETVLWKQNPKLRNFELILAYPI